MAGAVEAVRVSDYQAFLASKRRVAHDAGRVVEPDAIHPSLFDFQRAIVAWALRKGRAAIFADCGLGKTFMQVEWARLTGERALIVAPLSVARQTVREAAKIDVGVRYVRSGAEVDGPGVWITNYEMVEHFDSAMFGAVVLDESSILKNVDGTTRARLTKAFALTPFRLCCTATPAPNDVAELCNHAEFLGILPRNEMLAAFFVHDEIGWRIKGHAAGPMHEWMAHWAVALRRPSDLGYPDVGYELPPLTITPEVVEAEIEQNGQMFATDLGGVGGRSKVRRATLGARVDRCVELVRADDEQWIVWCGLNDESAAIARAIPGAVNVEGSTDPDEKARQLEAFQVGTVRVLVTKPKIAGFGMNFQQCRKMAFVGLNDSYEAYYQAIRRCWRFGQLRPVDVRIVVSALEQQIVQNVQRKEQETSQTTDLLIRFSPLRINHDGHRDVAAVHHRRVERRMLASTARR